MLQTILVVVLALVVWLAIEGWTPLPRAGGNQPRVLSHRLPWSFSLRTLLVAVTLLSIGRGTILYLIR
jgi:hypothetical protein